MLHSNGKYGVYFRKKNFVQFVEAIQNVMKQRTNYYEFTYQNSFPIPKK